MPSSLIKSKNPSDDAVDGGRARLSLDLDAQTKANFESLRKRTGTASLTDLIRKSVALYDLVTEHAAEGGKVVFRHKSGEEEQLRFL